MPIDVVNSTLISIHAPVKGATITGRARFSGVLISIHAPVKGATYRHAGRGQRPYNFNPRTREGCDWLFVIWHIKHC